MGEGWMGEGCIGEGWMGEGCSLVFFCFVLQLY